MGRPRSNPEDMRPAWIRRLSYERRYYWERQKRAMEQTLLSSFPRGVCIVSLQFASAVWTGRSKDQAKRISDLLKRVKFRHGSSVRHVWTYGVLEGRPLYRIAMDLSTRSACKDLVSLWRYGPAVITEFSAARMQEAVGYLCEYIDIDQTLTGRRKWSHSID